VQVLFKKTRQFLAIVNQRITLFDIKRFGVMDAFGNKSYRYSVSSVIIRSTDHIFTMKLTLNYGASRMSVGLSSAVKQKRGNVGNPNRLP
jgi:hypothetical protein